MRAKWLYVLLGDAKTGKTKFQKNLIKILSDDNKDPRLDCNLIFEITHPHIIRKVRNFSIGNRSIQEKLHDYKSVENYFAKHFRDADMCIISSHLSNCNKDISKIIFQGRRRFYNVCGLFFENSIVQNPKDNSDIAKLPWDERLFVENQPVEESGSQDHQLLKASEEFVQMLIERTRAW